MTNNIPHEMFERFANAAHKAAAHGLMRCSSGNLSWRVGPDLALVKGTRAWMADLRADQVALCRISDGSVLNAVKSSVETGFHLGVLKNRADADVVLHFQTPAATTICCRGRDTEFFILPEIPYYIGPIQVLPYIDPGSQDLAAAVTESMRTHNMVLLSNHGLVTCGKDFDDVIQKATFFELACEIILRAGGDVRPLPAEAVARHMAGKYGCASDGARTDPAKERS